MSATCASLPPLRPLFWPPAAACLAHSAPFPLTYGGRLLSSVPSGSFAASKGHARALSPARDVPTSPSPGAWPLHPPLRTPLHAPLHPSLLPPVHPPLHQQSPPLMHPPTHLQSSPHMHPPMHMQSPPPLPVPPRLHMPPRLPLHTPPAPNPLPCRCPPLVTCSVSQICAAVAGAQSTMPSSPWGAPLRAGGCGLPASPPPCLLHGGAAAAARQAPPAAPASVLLPAIPPCMHSPSAGSLPARSQLASLPPCHQPTSRRPQLAAACVPGGCHPPLPRVLGARRVCLAFSF